MVPPNAKESPKVEELLSENEVSSNDEVPDLERAADGDGDGSPDGASGRMSQNRSEKKNRKAIQKLGMKPVPGITQIRIRKNKAVTFVITDPEVYKNPGSETYIIFGEAKIEEQNSLAQSAAAANALAAVRGDADKIPRPQAARVEEVEDDDDALLNEEGLDTNDIELVMSQVSCPRKKAVKALRANDGDVVEAIMGISKH